MNNPWEEWPHIWNTKAKFMAWLRGGIRRGVWNRSPIKIEVIKENRKRIINPKTGKEIWGGACARCKQDFPQKNLQVDHIKGEHSLREISDIQSFVEAMTCLSKEDLALVCHNCHSTKSYAERMGISFEEAKLEKEVIAFRKLPAKEQLEKMRELDIKTKSTTKARAEAYREYLKELECR